MIQAPRGAPSFAIRRRPRRRWLAIVDQTGNTVKTLQSGHMTRGDYSVKVDAKDLASGTYYYVLTSGQTRLTKQLVVVK